MIARYWAAGLTFLAKEVPGEQAVDDARLRSHSDVQIIRLLLKLSPLKVVCDHD
jgi:hypothetical protein